MPIRAFMMTLVLTAAVAAAGCIEFSQSSTSPSNSLRNLAGSWSSTKLIPDPNACADFKWNVTEYTGTKAAGSFSAKCAGDLSLVGTAEGTLVGSVINWSAAATASAPDLPSCAIQLTGTAVLKDDTIEVPYSGTTCLGAVSGTEILKKR
jgi:hypothetical protein